MTTLDDLLDLLDDLDCEQSEAIVAAHDISEKLEIIEERQGE